MLNAPAPGTPPGSAGPGARTAASRRRTRWRRATGREGSEDEDEVQSAPPTARQTAAAEFEAERRHEEARAAARSSTPPCSASSSRCTRRRCTSPPRRRAVTATRRFERAPFCAKRTHRNRRVSTKRAFSRAPPRLYYRRGAALPLKITSREERDARVHHAAGAHVLWLVLCLFADPRGFTFSNIKYVGGAEKRHRAARGETSR